MLSPQNLNRIAIVGTSCSGKTTLARQLSQILSIPHIELDAIHWLPNWTERPLEDFRSKTTQAIHQEHWVLDGNYSTKVQDLVWQRATALIWLNYSLPLVFSRGLKRTFIRVITREKLYSNNQESLKLALSKDSILYWILTTHKRRTRQYPEKFKQNEHQHLNILEFNHPLQCNYWLREIKKYTIQFC